MLFFHLYNLQNFKNIFFFMILHVFQICYNIVITEFIAYNKASDKILLDSRCNYISNYILYNTKNYFLEKIILCKIQNKNKNNKKKNIQQKKIKVNLFLLKIICLRVFSNNILLRCISSNIIGPDTGMYCPQHKVLILFNKK